MFTDYLIKVVWVETLAFALALIKCCCIAKSIAGLPNIRETLLEKKHILIHICMLYILEVRHIPMQ